jgi:hypothetical protein
MANPPITIGSFANVPAPGSPIRSDWAQEISTYVQALPKGMLVRGTQAGPQSIGTTDTDVTGATATWSGADPTRRYRYTARLLVQKLGVAGDVFAYITDGAGTRTVGTGYTLAVNAWAGLWIEGIQSGLSGTQVRKLRVSCSAGTCSLGTNEYLGNVTIEDLGGSYPA